MNVICKFEDAECPANLKICCGVCDRLTSCDAACDAQNYRDCPDAEIITDEVVQFQSAVPDTLLKITELVLEKKRIEDQEKQLKKLLVEAMEKYGVKSFENDVVKFVYVAPTTRSTIDSTKLKKDHPDIVEQYSKTSPVSASVRITVKS